MRERVGNALIRIRDRIWLPPVCNICGAADGFDEAPKHEPREGWFCECCSSTSRDRMMVYALGRCLQQEGPLPAWRERPDVTLLETSGYRAHPPRLQAKFRYINLLYSGAAEVEFIHGDISRLGLRDESVDAVISSDVFEHVAEDEAGFAEVARILKPGGYLVLQVPRLGQQKRTEVRVEVRNGAEVHLLPAEYHAENTLVYRYYGNDLAARLTSFGLVAKLLTTRVRAHSITRQAILIAQKAASFDPHLAGL